ncbi:MAG: 1-(5-phosphoribosyl)-5-[(5-phosphoribosylamino)methylideneamino]imidazole-4-carboxamide isomerase [Alphaproteobacteria bacterium]|nr:1-(5-phosphoribosyl)-5-[(5-phosphoribosylamino)methylideneamino]imidazole-4-carboxamide isomerase [Alphaproteobacteria bacterium]
MILFPAIDLKDGACVRLLRGAMDQATVFNNDPADQAGRFEKAGFEWLHLVDLNGAIAGHPVNGGAVAAILAAVGIPVQLGGGIRDIGTVAHWLDAGVRRVILGTAAIENPALVREACRLYPGRVVVSIDARGGLVAVQGWTRTSRMRALDLALRVEEAGVAAIVFTDIDRDGALGGVNIDATVDLAFQLHTPVIASGGVSSMDDLRAVKAEEGCGLEGLICGRALYDGRIDPAAALAILQRLV